MTKPKDKILSEKLADSHYQPSKAEMEQEYDMPGAEMKDLRGALFNPPQAGRPKPGQE